MKKILDHKVGEYLYEGSGEDPFTAGKIVAMSESTTKKDTVYVLLKSDAGEYTIYSTIASCHCAPRVARFIPQEDFMDLISRMSSSGVATEPPVVKPEKKRRPVQEAGMEPPTPVPPPQDAPPVTAEPPPTSTPTPVTILPPEPDEEEAAPETADSDDHACDSIFDAILQEKL